MVLPTHIIAVGGFIRNSEGKILMVKHPRRGWEFSGGQVEVGETLPQALKREIFEETGVDIEINHLANIGSNVSVREGYNGVEKIPTIVSIYFICTYVSGELRVSDEHLDINWFTEDEVISMMSNPIIPKWLDNLINFNGKIYYNAYNADKKIIEETMI